MGRRANAVAGGSSPAEPYSSLEPLPDYARAWGETLRRPATFPPDYDTRIAKSDIFIFPNHPDVGESGPVYVVAKACSRCTGLRQQCNRGRPTCDQCLRSGGICVTEDLRWDPLPAVKFKKGKTRRSKSKAYGVKLQKKTAQKARHSATKSKIVVNSGRQSSAPPSAPGGRPRRSAAPAPGSLLEPWLKVRITDEGVDIDVPELVSNTAPADIPTTAPVVAVDTSPNCEQTRDSLVEKLHVKPGKRILKLIGPKKPVKSSLSKRSVPKVARAQKVAKVRSSTTSRKRLRTSPTSAGENTIGTKWEVVLPSEASPIARGTSCVGGTSSTRPSIELIPRIWAKNKAELLQIMPELAHSVNGLCCEHTETPIMLLDGLFWPEDRWSDDGKQFTITMVRECIIPKVSVSDLRESGANTDPDMTYTEPSSIMSLDNDVTVVDMDINMNSFDAEESSMELMTSDALLALGMLHDNPHKAIARKYAQMADSSPLAELNAISLDDYISPSSFNSVNVIATHGSFASPRVSSTATHSESQARGLTGAFSLKNAGYPASLERNDVLVSQVTWPSSVPNLLPSNPHPYVFSSSPSRPSLPTKVRDPPATVEAPSDRSYFRGSSLDSFEFEPYDPARRDSRTSLDSRAHVVADPVGTGQRPETATSTDSISSYSPMDEVVRNRIIRYDNDTHQGHDNLDSHPIPPTLAASTVPPTPLKPKPTISSDIPSEIRALLDAQKSLIPISIIASRDATILPFTVPEEQGCVFLGFFHVESTKAEVVSTISGNVDPAKLDLLRVSWVFTFSWTPGGEVDYTKPQPMHPWWTSPPASAKGGQDGDHVIKHPYSILPSHFTITPITLDDGTPATVSEICTRPGWHCTTCGKLNVQDLFCHQTCSKCSAGNGMSPVGAIYVRNAYNVAPISFPWDRYPARVLTSVAGEPGALRTFTYAVSDSIVIKHLFTCNLKSLQGDATKLFREVQLGVELRWQGANNDLAQGPYYTYLLGPAHATPDRRVPWDQAPPCVSSARELIQRQLQLCHDFTCDDELQEMDILAWRSSGKRKSNVPLPAKQKLIIFYCLGADVELTLIPRSGFPAYSQDERAVFPAVQDKPAHALPDINSAASDPEYDPTVEEDDPGAGLLAAVHAEEARQIASDAPISSQTCNVPGRLHTPKTKTEDIFITLVHGDLLLLRGDDFDWSMHRTGMSIVMIGS
ncbi:hypothetical protein K474DRAFT_871446 [Panus rudis PR-1116 ss-1]|nr:hypothetical protein K474DRAFT_871446 [Panus rudis PR-1116 ss-1]